MIGADPDLILPGERLKVPGVTQFPAASGGVFGDVDGNGKADVVTSRLDDANAWTATEHLSNGHAFTAKADRLSHGESNHFFGLVQGRFDSDSRTEVYGYNPDTTGDTLRLYPTETDDPQLSLSLPSGGIVQSVVSGNFDGVGHDDLAVVFLPEHGRAEIFVFSNTGTTTAHFSTARTSWATTSRTDVAGVAVGDFNADGRDDLVTYQPGEHQHAHQTSTLRLFTSTGHAFRTAPGVLRVHDSGHSAVVALRSPAAASTLLMVPAWHPDRAVRRVPTSTAGLGSPVPWSKGATAPGQSVFRYPGGAAVTTGDFNGDGFEDLAETTSTYSMSGAGRRPLYVWLGHGRTGSAPRAWSTGTKEDSVEAVATRGFGTPAGA